MSPVIRIPTKIYSRLEKHAQGFDSPLNVIERLLDHYEQISHDPSFHENHPPVKPTSRPSHHSVEAWKEHLEVALGFKQGSTELDDNTSFTRNIYNKFCEGEPAYGVSGVNAMEALFQVFKQYNPDKYDLALAGLRKTLEQSDKPFHKMWAFYEQLSNRK